MSTGTHYRLKGTEKRDRKGKKSYDAATAGFRGIFLSLYSPVGRIICGYIGASLGNVRRNLNTFIILVDHVTYLRNLIRAGCSILPIDGDRLLSGYLLGSFPHLLGLELLNEWSKTFGVGESLNEILDGGEGR